MSDGHTIPMYYCANKACKNKDGSPAPCCSQAKLKIVPRPHKTTLFE